VPVTGAVVKVMVLPLTDATVSPEAKDMEDPGGHSRPNLPLELFLKTGVESVDGEGWKTTPR
jgi:hypothetical protein